MILYLFNCDTIKIQAFSLKNTGGENYNIDTIRMKFWYNIDTLWIKKLLALGHRPWPADAFGDQLCDGPQWAPYNEHAHRFSSGNDFGDIGDVGDIGDNGDIGSIGDIDGPQWAPYNEHAHRFSSGNLGNISIDDIGDTGWYWGPLKEEKYSALRKVLDGKV